MDTTVGGQDQRMADPFTTDAQLAKSGLSGTKRLAARSMTASSSRLPVGVSAYVEIRVWTASA